MVDKKLFEQDAQDEGDSLLFSCPQQKERAGFHSLISRAMRLLSLRDHGEIELRRKLLTPQMSFVKSSSSMASRSKNQWEDKQRFENRIAEEVLPQHVQSVIDYCYQHNWLDDTKFAKSYINGRSNKGYGAQRIRAELQQRGVDKEIITVALEDCDIDWCIMARGLAERKFGLPLPTEWKEKSKVLRYLLYRGFFQEEIQSIYRDFDD